MPVYNRASMVERAIESVIGQDFTDFELIVVDDASSDGTEKVLASVQDRRVKIIRLDRNRGSNAARNVGIMAASAPILTFLDSDDCYLPHKLSSVVRSFRDQPELEVLVDSFVNTFPRHQNRADSLRRNPLIRSSEEFRAMLFSRRLWKATSAISVRREIVMRGNLFDETLGRRQDFSFLIQLAETARCASTDQVLWVKNWTPDAISAHHKGFIAATIELCRRHPAQLSDPAFRSGLSRDIARHFIRTFPGRKGCKSLREVGALTDEFGLLRFTGLLIRGLGELIVRGVSQSRRRAFNGRL